MNFLTTALRLRARGMGWFRTPIFVWSIVSASIIILLATSVVASSLIMVILDRTLGTTFFDAARGGNALLYQHLFWYYSHPAVYIMILPAFGVVLELLPVYARKPLFAYPVAAVSFLAIVLLSFVVWAHHLFTSGMWDALNIPFMVTTELISVPTGAVFLSALGTLWEGRVRLRTPMLFALGVLVNFLIGGLTGIFLADVPTDLHFHDTWFVMAHFHFTIVGGTIFAFFAGFYHWYPKITGRMLHEGLGRAHFALFMAGFNLVFIPMFWLGAHGMRRRVADYPAEMAPAQLWISLASLVVAASALVFVYNVVRSRLKGESAGADPWHARTLEWRTPSPPPHGNFEQAPEVTEPPYAYGA
ncbi:MAG: cbb3-type cytochrome c oxidase subunit I [Elusimicrobia bacterium]|nr:cbb3-type cytochrome c oxidase subunit I [Elusimicrobiota bacterium]